MPESLARDPLSLILSRLERRRRGVLLGRGIGLALAVAALGGLLGISLDIAFFLPQSTRWLIWGGWLGSIGLILAIVAFRACLRPVDRLALASRAERLASSLDGIREVERQYPNVELEALTASLSLARSPHGSPSLIAALAEQAAGLAEEIDPRRIVPGRPALRHLLIGGSLFALLIAPTVLAPAGAVRTRVRRFLSPWANLERAGAFTLLVEPGEARAAIGSRPTIRAEVQARGGGDVDTEDVWLEWLDEGDATSPPPRRLAMNGNTGRFSATMPRLNGAIRYRVVVGPVAAAPGRWWRLDASTSASPWYRLIAVEPPKLTGLRVTVELPAYTKRAATLMSASPSPNEPLTIEAFEGSRIILDARANVPLRSFTARMDAESSSTNVPPSISNGTLADDRRSASAVVTAEVNGTLAIALADEQGVAGTADVVHRLVVRRDAPPRIAVEELDRGPDPKAAAVEARADEVIRIGVNASDDVAVASLQLRAEVERSASPEGEPPLPTGSKPVVMSIPLSETSEGDPASPESSPVYGPVVATASFRLEPLGLRPGDRVIYRVRVADNRPSPKGPNVVWSEPRTIAIVKRADTLAERRLDAARAAIQAQLDAVKQATAKLRQEAERLRYAADAARLGNGEWNDERQSSLTRREQESGQLVEELQRLAALLESRPRPRAPMNAEADYHTLAPSAREAADRDGESSRASLERARRARPETQPKSPPTESAEAASKRLDALRLADAHLAALATRLEDLQARFDATKPRRNGGSGQGRESDSRKEDLASKEPGTEEGNEKGSRNPQTSPEEKDRNAAGAGKGQAKAGKGQAGQTSKAGKPGNGPAAPTAYPALHEEAEPMPEANAGDLAALRNQLQKRSGRPWAELPGQLRSRILRMPQVRFRNEYSRQIERYYRELAEPPQAGRRPSTP